MKLFATTLIASLALLANASVSLANSPSLGNIVPRGAQRGTEIELQLQGGNLLDAQEVLFYEPGIAVKKLEVVNTNAVKVTVAIAPDCKLGQHTLRLRAASGISELRTFWVGALPVVNEVEPNSDFKTPQKIAMNVTVQGVVENEDVDHYLVEAKKGQRITAEIEGLRLGNSLFDSYVSIMDMNRFDLSANDDSALLLQDPVASIVAPADGTYIVQVRETSYGGNGGCQYRLHVGTFPRPRTIYPAGGKAGEDMNVQFLGDAAGVIPQSIKVPADQVGMTIGLFPEQAGQPAPSPCYFRVSDFANVLEAEPNNDVAHATRYDGELPVAFNGVISQDKDVDWFRFKAHKGQVLDVNVYARRLRSPLDPVLVIGNKDGGGLTSNDDSGGPDSYIRFTAPEEGEYTFQIYDQLLRGYVDGIYRVEITPVKLGLTMSIPSVGGIVPTQERQAMAVPRGNRFATLVRATRHDIGGEVSLEIPELPAGVTIANENVNAGLDVVPVVFEAKPDAPIAGKLVPLIGKPVDPNVQKLLQSRFSLSSPLIIGPNNTPFYSLVTEKLAVSVTEEAPFKIQIVEPKVPIVQDGQLNLKVTCERKPDFKGPINLRMLFDPPGTSAGQVAIPPDKNEALLPVNANGGAGVKKWKIAVLGFGDGPAAVATKEKPLGPGMNPGGQVWVSTQLAELEVAPRIFTAKIDLAATEQGKPAQVVVHLENVTKYDGDATLRLVGLPNLTKAEDLKVKTTDKQVIFNVTTDAKTPVGQHNQLFCSLILPKNGEEIIQSMGGGGVLRVDAPPPPKPNEPAPAATPAAAPAPAAPTEKPLTRLEKLRLEQQQKQAGK